MASVTIMCVECQSGVELDACSSCDGEPVCSCEECEGSGAVHEGVPVKLDDVLCGSCFTADRRVATRDWFDQ